MKRFILLMLSCAAIAALAVPAADAHHSNGQVSVRAKAKTKACGLDKEYLKESMAGDLFEIKGGKLAERKSKNAAVLTLARTLIRDHTKSYKDAVDLAKRFGIKVETKPSPPEQWELQAVARFKGAKFNHQYALLEVLDHENDIDLAQSEAGDGCASAIRSSAREELPMLERHLDLSKKALAANR